MNETVKKIDKLMNEVEEIQSDPDIWWEKERQRKEALNQGFEYAEDDPRFEQYQERLK